MKLLVAMEGRFQSVDGVVYSHHLSYDRFWKRYLDVFDSVLVASRVKAVGQIPEGWERASGPRVDFCKIPDYQGPVQYLQMRSEVIKVLKKAIHTCDAYILRVAGTIGNVTWKCLDRGAPFGIEVVSIPWEAWAPKVIKSAARPIYRRIFHHCLKKQCQQAVAAAYVTQYVIQRRYPPNREAFTTNYSSIDLESDNICTNPEERLARIDGLRQRLSGGEPPIRLGFIGTFSLGHKLPDVHIKAVSRCAAQGINVVMEMIGDGSKLSDMKNLARKLGIADRIIFSGRIPGGKPILEAIDRFDILVSATATEGLPRVVIEAMARGCPCVGSNIGGMPELIPADMLVPRFDDAALASKIIEILNDQDKMKRTVLCNIDKAREYSRESLTPRRRQFYEAIRDRTEKYLASRRTQK